MKKLFEKFEINKLNDLSKIAGGATSLIDDSSLIQSEGDCEIDTGDACDWTNSSDDCEVAVIGSNVAVGTVVGTVVGR